MKIIVTVQFHQGQKIFHFFFAKQWIHMLAYIFSCKQQKKLMQNLKSLKSYSFFSLKKTYFSFLHIFSYLTKKMMSKFFKTLLYLFSSMLFNRKNIKTDEILRFLLIFSNFLAKKFYFLNIFLVQNILIAYQSRTNMK